jgi:hypothetical protein
MYVWDTFGSNAFCNSLSISILKMDLLPNVTKSIFKFIPKR